VFIHDEKVQTSGQRFNAVFGTQVKGLQATSNRVAWNIVG
jgi:hypothetical protein